MRHRAAGWLSLTALWRLRRVSKPVGAWAAQFLGGLPLVAMVGGSVAPEDDPREPDLLSLAPSWSEGRRMELWLEGGCASVSALPLWSVESRYTDEQVKYAGAALAGLTLASGRHLLVRRGRRPTYEDDPDYDGNARPDAIDIVHLPSGARMVASPGSAWPGCLRAEPAPDAPPSLGPPTWRSLAVPGAPCRLSTEALPTQWQPAPACPVGFPAPVALADGRLALFGAPWGTSALWEPDHPAGVLADDAQLCVQQDPVDPHGSARDRLGWARRAIAPTVHGAGCVGVAAGLLGTGQVLVAGGVKQASASLTNSAGGAGHPALEVVASAAVWDPTGTGRWAAAPPMATPRRAAICCPLPSGRVAVLGGCALPLDLGFELGESDGVSPGTTMEEALSRGEPKQHIGSGEVFDGRAWSPLPTTAAVRADLQLGGAALQVHGGLLLVPNTGQSGTRCSSVNNETGEKVEGGAAPIKVWYFAEAEGRWYDLQALGHSWPPRRPGHTAALLAVDAVVEHTARRRRREHRAGNEAEWKPP
jgi:hypothetical protein